MFINFEYAGQPYRCDLSAPLDISIPIQEGFGAVNCFYAPPMETAPVVAGSFVGSTAQGGPVNFLNVKINPHGNGTHTECVGHIAREPYSIHQSLQQFHFLAALVSVYPQRLDNGDRMITRKQLEALLPEMPVQALVVRSQPNDELKLRTQYSGTNPPYFEDQAMSLLVERGIEHLLTDLPSVDREEDEGKLLAHRAFWLYPHAVRAHCTISELIFVKNSIPDGLYLLNIQIASFEIDVSPSKPVLYKLV